MLGQKNRDRQILPLGGMQYVIDDGIIRERASPNTLTTSASAASTPALMSIERLSDNPGGIDADHFMSPLSNSANS